MKVTELVIRKASVDDLQLLYSVCRQCYTENFSDHWQPGGLELYLDLVYGMEALRTDLNNHDIHYYLAFADNTPVGFLKVQANSNLPGQPPMEGLEIDKIYFLKSQQGKGYGKQLLNIALSLAGQLKKKIIWLAVIDTNKSSIEFYQKLGFKYHSSTQVPYLHFKEELRGMWRMVLGVAKD